MSNKNNSSSNKNCDKNICYTPNHKNKANKINCSKSLGKINNDYCYFYNNNYINNDYQISDNQEKEEILLD